jgi:molybdopterin converting factor subunit 1
VTIRVKLFAILKDRAGVAETEMQLPDGATVATAVDQLAGRYPAIRPSLRSTAYAVNLAYAPAHTALQHGDELALIPPVSGG